MLAHGLSQAPPFACACGMVTCGMLPIFTANDGTRLAYDVRGNGKALLCLPGLTRTMADFDYVVPHLSARVIRMDYRGRGQSGWSGAASYTVLHEAQDALALLEHLGIERFAVLGTSRGGLIGMLLAHLAPGRLLGICLNDVGPVIEPAGLVRIAGYVGRNPAGRDHAEYAERLAQSPGFAGVPESRWQEEACKHARETGQGLQITYDPALRDAFLAGMASPPVDLWPLFDACAGMPMAVIRGANSDLLSAATVVEMARRHPGMITGAVPDRAHVPFLDEPESLDVITRFLGAL